MALLNEGFDRLPMRTKCSICAEAACSSLRQYGLPRLNGIRVLGDMTAGTDRDVPGYVKFRIDGGDGTTSLMAIYYRLSGHPATEVIDSYLTWMAALSAEADLLVPQPILTESGARSSSSRLHLSSGDGLQFDSVILTWLPGEVFIQGEERRDPGGQGPPQRQPEDLYQLGVVIGKMHRHSATWEIPDGFWSRPPRSSATATQAVEMRHSNGNGAGRSHIEEIELVASLVDEELRSASNIGVCHGDLGGHNMVVRDGEFGVIDFDGICVYQYYEELMSAIIDMEPGLRRHVVDGYESVVGPVDQHRLAAHVLRWRLRDGFGIPDTPWPVPEIHTEVWEFISRECECFLKDEQDFLFVELI